MGNLVVMSCTFYVKKHVSTPDEMVRCFFRNWLVLALFLPVLALHRSILLVFVSCVRVQVERIEITSDPGMEDKVGTTISREVGRNADSGRQFTQETKLNSLVGRVFGVV